MGLLRRRGGGRRERVPAWAAFLDTEQHEAFMGLVAGELDARAVRWTLGDGFVQLSEGDDTRVLGLTNLARLCEGLDRAAWPEAIGGHFGTLLDEPESPPPVQASEALRAVRVRVQSRAGLALDDPPVTRPIADDLVAVLVLDLPGAVVEVRPGDAEGWGQTDAALWEHALDSTRAAAATGLERSPLVLPGDVEVAFGFADGPFTASNALWPEDLAGALGPAGALVAIPNRRTVAVHAIRTMAVLEGMRHLVPLIARQHAEGPGSISDQLYWFRDGELTRLPTTLDGDWVSVTPPAPFVSAINALSEHDDTGPS